MNRFKDLKIENMNEEQSVVYNEIASGPRGNVIGPLQVWLNNPKLASHAQLLGKYARYDSNLKKKLSELAIITTGRCWSSEFEWEHHVPLAIKFGIDIKYIKKIELGMRPIFKNKKEQTVFDFSAEVNLKKKVSDKLYKEAINLLGKNAVIDIVAICGYYTLVSMTLNVFEIKSDKKLWPLPEVNNFTRMLK